MTSSAEACWDSTCLVKLVLASLRWQNKQKSTLSKHPFFDFSHPEIFIDLLRWGLWVSNIFPSLILVVWFWLSKSTEASSVSFPATYQSCQFVRHRHHHVTSHPHRTEIWSAVLVACIVNCPVYEDATSLLESWCKEHPFSIQLLPKPYNNSSRNVFK